jgi:hypothetical protein
LEENKKWKGLPTILGIIALVVVIALIYTSLFILMGILTVVILCILCITCFADVRYRNKLSEKRKSDIMEKMDKIDDLKAFLKEKLSSDWEKIKLRFEAYNAGEIEKSTFVNTAIKYVGKKFIEIFKEERPSKNKTTEKEKKGESTNILVEEARKILEQGDKEEINED